MINQNSKLLILPLVGKSAMFGVVLIDYVHTCTGSKNFHLIRLQYTSIFSLALNNCDVEHTREWRRERKRKKKGEEEEERQKEREETLVFYEITHVSRQYLFTFSKENSLTL